MSINPNRGLDSPLTEAVLCGHSSTVGTLLTQGANPNHCDGHFPLLLLAVLRDDVPTASALLEAGAQANARCDVDRPRNWMMAMGLNCLGQKYLPHGSKYSGAELFHASPLTFASSAAMARLLLAHGASPAEATGNYFLCSRQADDELLDVLLRAAVEAGLRMDAVNRDSLPLHDAAAAGRADLLELMLAAGANPDQQDACKRSPLHVATTPEVVRLLLTHGATLNQPDEDCLLPLGAACEAGHEAVAAELRAQGARRLHVKPAYLPGLCELARCGDIRRATLSLQNGADVNERSEYGATPLFFSQEGAMTTLLLKHGADVHARDEFGTTALQHAPNAKKRRQILAAAGLPENTPIQPLPRFLPRYQVHHPGTRPIPCGILSWKGKAH